MVKRISALEGSPQSPPPSQSAGDSVFLAENSFRSHAEREEVRAALREAGFEARPAASLAGKPPGELTEAMAGALAFVQIVSQYLLEIPGTQGATYDQAQLEAARVAGLPTFRWRAPDFDSAHADSREFADAPDVRRQLLATFKADLITALIDLRGRQRVQNAAQGDERLVIIAGEPDDLDTHATRVGEQLQNRALGHYITEDPTSELQAEDVRGFLVLYGGSRAEGVRDRLKVVRALPKSRQRDLRVGIYFCEPPPDYGSRRLLFDMPSFKKIRWDDPPALDAFAQAVAQ